MIIYKATNLINNKIYIGKTKKTLETRIKEHLRARFYSNKSPIYFYKALNKYGPDKFKWEIVNFGINDQDLSLKEIEAIKKFKSCDHKYGYNISPGGTGGDSFINNPNRTEYIIKLKKAHLGKKVSWKTKQRIRKSLIGRKRPKEIVEKIKKSLKGYGKGRKLPTETINKMKKSRIGIGYIILSKELIERIIFLYKNKKSMADIGKMIGYSRTIVNRTLKENFIKPRKSGRQRKNEQKSSSRKISR